MSTVPQDIVEQKRQEELKRQRELSLAELKKPTGFGMAMGVDFDRRQPITQSEFDRLSNRPPKPEEPISTVEPRPEDISGPTPRPSPEPKFYPALEIPKYQAAIATQKAQEYRKKMEPPPKQYENLQDVYKMPGEVRRMLSGEIEKERDSKSASEDFSTGAANTVTTFARGTIGAAQVAQNAAKNVATVADRYIKSPTTKKIKDQLSSDAEFLAKQQKRIDDNFGEASLPEKVASGVVTGTMLAPAFRSISAVTPSFAFGTLGALDEAGKDKTSPQNVVKAFTKGATLDAVFKGAGAFKPVTRAGIVSAATGAEALAEGADPSEALERAAVMAGLSLSHGGGGRIGAKEIAGAIKETISKGERYLKGKITPKELGIARDQITKKIQEFNKAGIPREWYADEIPEWYNKDLTLSQIIKLRSRMGKPRPAVEGEYIPPEKAKGVTVQGEVVAEPKYLMPSEFATQPRAGGIAKGAPGSPDWSKSSQTFLKKAQEKPEQVQSGPRLRLTDDVTVKDIHGNKTTFKKGHELSTRMMGGQVLAQDGNDAAMPKNQFEALKGKAIELGEKSALKLPEGLEVIVKGDRGYAEKVREQRGIPSGEEVDVGLPKHAQHITNRGENYKETLVVAPVETIPEKPFTGSEKDLPVGWRLQEATNNPPDRRWLIIGQAGIAEYAAPTKEGVLRKALVTPSPQKPATFKSSHWGEPNVVTHILSSEYQTPQGDKVFNINETQSDWEKKLRSDKSTPSHPHLKNWLDLSLTQALKDAVDSGAKYLSWDDGQTVKDRYDLSKHVDKIYWERQPDGNYKLDAWRKDTGGYLFQDKVVTPKELSEWVGKDLSKKITESPKRYQMLDNLELRSGGEWADHLYNRLIPKGILDKTKKLGGKLVEIEVNDGSKKQAILLTPEIIQAVQGGLQPMAGGITRGKLTLEGLVKGSSKVPSGMTRLYRVEPKDLGNKGEWLKNSLTQEQYKEFLSRRGRLFSDNIESLKNYGWGSGDFNHFYVDVPNEVAQKIASKHPDGFMEYLLPDEYLAQKKEIAQEQPAVGEQSLLEEARKYKTAEEFVDAQGKPVYHGTNKEIKRFKISSSGDLGEGAYFTPDKYAAQRFAWGKAYNQGGKQKIYEVYLYYNKPLKLGIGIDGEKALEFYRNRNYQAITKLAKENGYDAVIREGIGDIGDEIAVFSPKQIKTKSQLTDIWNRAHGVGGGKDFKDLKLFHGSKGKVSEETKSFENVWENDNQNNLLKELARDGVKEAGFLVGKYKPNNWVLSDRLIAKIAKSRGYDAVMYSNSDRPQLGFEIHDVNEGKFYAEKREVAELYARQSRDLKYIQDDPFNFQDSNQEKIIQNGKWNTHNPIRHSLEGAGDIFRELSKEGFQSTNYINEKIKRLDGLFSGYDKKALSPEETIAGAWADKKEYMESLLRHWENQPTNTPEQSLAKDFNIELLKGNIDKAKNLLKQIKTLERVDNKLELAKTKSVGAAGKDLPTDNIPLEGFPKKLQVKNVDGEIVNVTTTPKEKISIDLVQNPDGTVEYELHDGKTVTIPASTALKLAKQYGKNKIVATASTVSDQLVSDIMVDGKKVPRPSFRVDKINAPEDVINLMKEVAEKEGEFKSQRPTGSLKELQRLAKEAKITVDDLLDLPPGSIVASPELIKANQIRLALAKDLSDYSKKIDTSIATPEELRIFKEKTLRFTAVMKTLAGMRTEASNIFRAFQIINTPQDEEALRELLGDIKRIDKDAAGDLEQFAKNTRKAMEPTTADKIWHLWYASILSGPLTHIKNITSNVVQLGLELGRISLTSPTEVPSAIFGLLSNMSQAGKDSFQAFTKGKISKLEDQKKLPVRFTGRFTRLLNVSNYVGNALEGVDTFFKTLTHGMDMRQMAFVEGKSKGLKGKKLHQFINERVQNPTEEMQAAAKEYMLYMTYQQRPNGILGVLAEALGKAAKKQPTLRPIVPFTRVVANVANNAIDWTPWGFVRWGFEKYRDVKGQEGRWAKDKRGRGKMLGRALVGTLAMTAFAYLAAQEKLTGRGPSDPKKRKQMLDAGWRPHSFVFADKDGNKTYIPYTYILGPAALAAAIPANFFDAIRYGDIKENDALDRASVAILGSMRLILDMSFLNGISDTLSAIENYDLFGPSYLKRMMSQLTAPLVPNLVKQVDRYFDPTVYNTDKIKDYLLNSMRITSGLKPQINLLGDAVVGDKLTQFTTSKLSKDPVKQFLFNNNLFISVPNKNSKLYDIKTGEMREMTDEEMYNFIGLSGLEIRKRLEDGNTMMELLDIKKTEDALQPGLGQEAMQDELNKIVRSARSDIKYDMEDNVAPKFIPRKQ